MNTVNMKLPAVIVKFSLISFFFLGAFSGVFAQAGSGNGVNIGLIYPISSNGTQARQCTNNFSLNILVGVSRSETGIAMAGLSNVVIDSASGLQIAGFSNHVGVGTHDVMIAGFLNSVGSSDGVNIAGFANVARRSSTGTQVAGFLNKSGDVNTQVAGFVNVAKKVKGVQIAGFINIADSSEYPIGLINIIKHGEKAISITTDETLTTLVSFRSGSRRLYGIAGLGFNDKGKRQLYAWEAGIGGHLITTEFFRLNIELASVGLTDFKTGDYQRSALRVLPALRIGNHLEIFGGPSFNHIYCNKGQGSDLITHYAWSETTDKGNFKAIYFGFTGGLQVRF